MTEPGSRSQGKVSAARAYLIFIFITVVGSFFTVMVFFRLYNVSKQNIINSWNTKTIQMSQRIEYYLFTPKDAVSFTAQNVEGLMDAGATNDEIKRFLEDETEVYTQLIDSNTTGVYAYCNGEYLDGSGWVSPAGYDATTRPWYIEAKNKKGEVTFVQPYVNMQTNEVMMSVSKLLKDGESVVSMDIFMDGISEIERGLVSSNTIDASMVIDKTGFVVCHSDNNENGKNYGVDGDEYQKALASRIMVAGGKTFSMKFEDGSKLVFSRPINNEWFTVVIVDEDLALKSVDYIFMQSSFVLAMILIAFLVAFSVYAKSNTEARHLQNEINAISDIYASMTRIDLKNMTMKELRISPTLESAMGGDHDNTLQRRLEIAKGFAAESSQSMLMSFLDLSTLEERFENTKSVSHDFLSKRNQWFRMYFIEEDRDPDGSLRHVLWATESIDEDRRRQEQFRKKAETDALTGILNRGGGEARIFEAFENGKKGMLILLDADHFKYVNDTFGHDVGDEVIKAIAKCLTDTFRDSDVVYRLGGDEFCVFATGVENIETGRIVADRLFYNIDSIRIKEVGDWRVKVSVGAVLCGDGADGQFSDYYKLADQAMYESKQVEGNYITFSDN
ncbi:sensor domain-containing diguanylate cyclase [Butyrivibrio proteoclasticus]|uniref:sensor domain-containing diguanylate cyclase n=1 Tax=Butyrivibrio proteoclasticus TaxID=43305 RepID=UPI00047AC8C3|nr:sensor domain-containing diguanylate cyclase [Butyrivibrio proteoclasticus]